jgi:hypothetical protein
MLGELQGISRGETLNMERLGLSGLEKSVSEEELWYSGKDQDGLTCPWAPVMYWVLS